MYNHGDGATQDRIGPKFGTMAHTIVPTISCHSYSTTESLQLRKHVALILLPVEINGGEEFVL